ncbi:MAG: response regulator [Lachnospiraceae bacterium]|nr:response regulator [Lachnospiraceae bacterium]
MENVKILICDDSILARKQLKDAIIKCGYDNFLEASNGQEAIDTYKEHKPDLVFVDIVMPIKDGVEAIHEIREFDPNAHVIVVSSVGTQTQLKNAIMEGARDFIQKPFSSSSIKDIIRARFEGR